MELISMGGIKKEDAINRNGDLGQFIRRKKLSTQVYANRSMCCLSTTNKCRAFFMNITGNQLFKNFIVIVILVNSITLAFEDPPQVGVKQSRAFEVMEIVFISIFTFEMFIKIVAMGFLSGQGCYLHDPWNILDFVVVISSWVNNSIDSVNLSFLRIFRIIRPLRAVHQLPALSDLVNSIVAIMPSMIEIGILFQVTILMGSAIALQLFKGSLQGRCVKTTTISTLLSHHGTGKKNVYQKEYLAAGEIWLSNPRSEEYTICKIGGEKSCPNQYTCVRRVNPSFDLQSFDDFPSASLVMFEIMTLEGWSSIMYMIRQAKQSQIYDIFFLVVVMFGSFFVMNLMTAVMFSQFSQFNSQRRREKLMLKKMEIFFLPPKRDKKWNEKCCNYKATNKKNKLSKFNEFVESKGFEFVILGVIILNSMILGTEYYGQPDWLTKIQSIANYIFTAIFSLEMLLRILSKGPLEYITDFLHLFDGIIVLISITESFLPETNSSVSVFRAFRILRIFKLMHLWPSLKAIMKTIVLSVPETVNLGLLMCIFIFINALIGKQFFHSLTASEDDPYLHYNFKSISRSALMVFICMTGESWTTIMHTTMAQVGSWTCIYFIFIVLIGKFMILNLFLAIILEFSEGMRTVDELILRRETKETAMIMGITECRTPGHPNTERFDQYHKNIHNQSLDYALAAVYELRKQMGIQAKDRNPSLVLSEQRSQCPIKRGNSIKLEQSNLLNAYGSLFGQEIQPQVKRMKSIIFPNAGNFFDLKDDTDLACSSISSNSSENSLDSSIHTDQSMKSKMDVSEESLVLNEDLLHEQSSITSSVTSQSSQFFGDIKKQRVRRNNFSLTTKKRMSIMTERTMTGRLDDGLMRLMTYEEREKQTRKAQRQINALKKESIDRQFQRANSIIRSGMRMEGVSDNWLSELQEHRFKSRRTTKVNLDGTKSLFCFSDSNCFRIWIITLVENSYFDSFVFNLIFLNSLILMLDEPQLTNPYSKATIETINDIINALYVFEAVFRIIAMGFICGKHTYMKDPFNVFDFVIILLTALGSNSKKMDYISSFRSLRALRPLRMIKQNEQMKIVVNSLLSSIPMLANVFLVTTLFYYVFAILAVQLMMGKMSSCTLKQFTDKKTCLNSNGTWVLPHHNYGNVLNAMSTLFEVSTLEMWPDIMFAAIRSSKQIDEASNNTKDQRPWMALLFIGFIFIMVFFILHMFVSVIIQKFQQETEKFEGTHLLNDQQKEWTLAIRFMLEAKVLMLPKSPSGWLRGKLFHLVQHQWFETFLSIMICLNLIVLCLEYHHANETYIRIIRIINICFMVLFAFEAVAKILGLGHKFYFRKTDNIFDFIIVISSLAAIIFEQTQPSIGSKDNAPNVTVLRLIRVLRLLRLAKSSQRMNWLLKTIKLALQNIVNTMLLYALLLFTFTITGMDLFGHISLGKNGHINENVNFKGFSVGFMVLLRASTGEDWNSIMHDTYLEDSHNLYQKIFWMSFMIISYFIFINMFVSVIFEQYLQVMTAEKLSKSLSIKKNIDRFSEIWSQYDSFGSGYMPTKHLKAFLRQTPSPLGYEDGSNMISNAALGKIIDALNIPDYEGRVYFPEVMWPLFHALIGNSSKKLDQHKWISSMLKAYIHKFQYLSPQTNLDSLTGNIYHPFKPTAGKYFHGMTILMAYRKYKLMNKTKIADMLTTRKFKTKDSQMTVEREPPRIIPLTSLCRMDLENQGKYESSSDQNASFSSEGRPTFYRQVQPQEQQLFVTESEQIIPLQSDEEPTVTDRMINLSIFI